ncbi:hypothetical protein NKG05_23560 [Oerskovia sp. M15]
MVPMKTDMAGAAVALAVVLGAVESGVKHKVTAVLPLAENHVGRTPTDRVTSCACTPVRPWRSPTRTRRGASSSPTPSAMPSPSWRRTC